MKKLFLSILLLPAFGAFGQLNSTCFMDAQMKRQSKLPSQVNVGDTTEAVSILALIEDSWKEVLGCRIPYSPFRTWDGKEMNYDKIKTVYTVMNFNYAFCNSCMDQLDTLVQTKRSGKDITIISYFNDHLRDVQPLIDKYRDDVIFVVDESGHYTQFYNVAGAKPLNYVLDKGKYVIYAHRNVPEANVFE